MTTKSCPSIPPMVGLCLLLGSLAASVPASEAFDFDRDIRPILSDHCFPCHGPDAQKRKAGLRLDTSQGAQRKLPSGAQAVVPKDPDSSELWRRITAENPEDRMPPPESKLFLQADEVARLRRWIEDGAPWAEHWAFRPLRQPAVPGFPQADEAVEGGNPIDAFIARRLREEDLTFSEEASRATLIRRLSLDLTGLPPTPEEVDAFRRDASPGAYEAVVDRLLESPHYGERMAWDWLDAARYADTDGFQGDPTRDMWPWRDWLVEALNDNMPFDRFTIEMLAGDLLRDATPKQRLASGFNRNHTYNGEGGRIAEETRVENVFDRTETTSTVWLGLTMTCARCHDHKYDPISQKEYYQLYAFFNNTSESGQGRSGKAPPIMRWETARYLDQWQEWETEEASLRRRLAEPNPEMDQAQRTWESTMDSSLSNQWRFLSPARVVSKEGATMEQLDDFSFRAGGKNPEHDTYEILATSTVTNVRVVRLEALLDPAQAAKNVGRDEKGNFVLTEIEFWIRPQDRPDADFQRLTVSSASADHTQGGFAIEQTFDGDPSSPGWAVDGHRRREPRQAVFHLDSPVGFLEGTEWRVVMAFQSRHKFHNLARGRLSVAPAVPVPTTVSMEPWQVLGPIEVKPGQRVETWFPEYFGSAGRPDLTLQRQGRSWREEPNWKDGEVHALPDIIASTFLFRSIEAPEPQPLDLSLGSDDGIRLWINGALVLDKDIDRAAAPDQERVQVNLGAGRNGLLMQIMNTGGIGGFYFKSITPETNIVDALIPNLVAIPEPNRTEGQRDLLRAYYRRRYVPEGKRLHERLAEVEQLKERARNDRPAVMIMDELSDDQRRRTVVLSRGTYDKPTDIEVVADTPAALPPLPPGAPRNRLTLARWLVDPDHPLTARVTVNRYWQAFFGRGQVETSEDFGSQGAKPTHPELLDWLARRFIDSGWNVKALHRLIVTSRTYRQSSRVTPALLEKDPENRWLARGPRYRMPSWMLRDQALAVSGLLNPAMGGPPVRPYQPDGIWAEATFGKIRYTPDSGDDLYRRSLYVFWRRIVGPTMFFDSGKRQTCEVKPTRTNTPLHALATLNDTTYVEAARAMAQRVWMAGREDEAGRIDLAFRLVLARDPDSAERQFLAERLGWFEREFSSQPEAARALLSVGDSPASSSESDQRLAAFTMLCSILLNLDETLNKM